MHYRIIGCIVLLFSISVCNASIKSIESTLNKKDFVKAKQNLDKESKKDSTNYAYSYLYAKYYFASSNKNYRPDSALYFIDQCANLYRSNNNAKLLIANDKIGIKSENINLLFHQIELELFYIAKNTNTLSSYENTLALKILDTMLVADLKKSRDIVAFQEANSKNDFLSFKEFMEKYPDANQAGQAKENYENLLYKTATDINTWQAYKNYIDQYPQAKYIGEAKEKYENLLYEDFTKNNDAKKIYSYISNYPSAKYWKDADRKLFKLSCSTFDDTTLMTYINNYPKATLSWQKAWDYLYLYNTYNDDTSSYIEFIKKYPTYYNTKRFREDSAQAYWTINTFEKEGKIGYLKNDSIILQNAKYNETGEFNSKYALISTDCINDKCKYNFINKQAIQLSPNSYDEAFDFESGVAIVGAGDCPDKNCFYGMINELGDTIVPFIYEQINDISCGSFLALNKDGKYGFLNSRGANIIPFKYTKARNFKENLAFVCIDSNCFFINTIGAKQDSFPTMKLSSDFINGVASFSADAEKWGAINSIGKLLHPAQYKEQLEFVDGIATGKKEDAVVKKNKTTYVLNTYELKLDGSAILKK
jgi:hypothetical protein